MFDSTHQVIGCQVGTLLASTSTKDLIANYKPAMVTTAGRQCSSVGLAGVGCVIRLSGIT